MNADDLKTVWTCLECGRNFIFYSDLQDHKREFGHKKVMMCDIPSGKRKPSIFFYGQAMLNFFVNGKAAVATFKYKYYPSKEVVRYLDVSYSNPQLESMIEGDSRMMERVDGYLKKLLKKNRSEISR